MLSPSDTELVDQAKQGDRRAYGVLVRRHQASIYRLAVHMLRNEADAQEITQETFVRGFQALSRFEGNSQPFTWLYRIAVNLSLNLIRARKVRRSDDADDPRIDAWISRQQAPSDPAQVAHQKQLGVALLQGIDSLSDTLRTTLIMVCIEGMPQGEVASILGCPEGTIAWRVHEARRKLRGQLEEQGLGGFDEDTAA